MGSVAVEEKIQHISQTTQLSPIWKVSKCKDGILTLYRLKKINQKFNSVCREKTVLMVKVFEGI